MTPSDTLPLVLPSPPPMSRQVPGLRHRARRRRKPCLLPSSLIQKALPLTLPPAPRLLCMEQVPGLRHRVRRRHQGPAAHRPHAQAAPGGAGARRTCCADRCCRRALALPLRGLASAHSTPQRLLPAALGWLAGRPASLAPEPCLPRCTFPAAAPGREAHPARHHGRRAPPPGTHPRHPHQGAADPTDAAGGGGRGAWSAALPTRSPVPPCPPAGVQRAKAPVATPPPSVPLFLQGGGMQDPNADFKEIFDTIESIPTAPKRLLDGFNRWFRCVCADEAQQKRRCGAMASSAQARFGCWLERRHVWGLV